MKQFFGTPRLRLCLLGLTAVLLVAGCADKPTRRAAATSTQRTVAAKPLAKPVATSSARKNKAPVSAEAGSSAPRHLPEQTGIAACDDYLASYKACHRAANIYAPEDIEHRYQLMRKSLLRDSQDAASHDQMAARCNALATSLRDALHGKACQPLPADEEAGTAQK